MRRRTTILLSAVAAFAQPGLKAHHGASDPTGRLFANLEGVLTKEMRDRRVPGVQVAIVRGRELVYSRAFGVASVETRQPLSRDHLLRVASTTKMFTAAAVVKAAEMKGVRLDQPVASILPALHPSVGRLTLRQLLSHTSGLLDTSAKEGPQDEAAPMEWALKFDDRSFFTEPEEVFSYANPDYELAGALLSSMTGERFADAMDRLLLRPLGIAGGTTFRMSMAITYPVAAGHLWDTRRKRFEVVRPLWSNTVRWPSGGMFSTAERMARLCGALMNGGVWKRHSVLSQRAVREMLRPSAGTRVGTAPRWYSLGLNIVDDRGLRLAQHAGGTEGFGSFVRMVPKERIAVVVLANATNASLPKTLDAAVATFRPFGRPEPPKAPQPIGEADVARFAGTYANGELVFTISGERGRLRMRIGDDVLSLSMLSRNELSLRFGNPGIEGSVLETDLPVVDAPDGSPRYLHFLGRALKRRSNARPRRAPPGVHSTRPALSWRVGHPAAGSPPRQTSPSRTPGAGPCSSSVRRTVEERLGAPVEVCLGMLCFLPRSLGYHHKLVGATRFEREIASGP